jgi:hypothetical protein
MHRLPCWLICAALSLAPNAHGKELNGFVLDEPLVPAAEIVKGGPPRDGIPSLEKPKFVAAKKARFLSDNDRVLGISLNGVSRAYPIRILNYHEIVNDVFPDGNGFTPVVVTYCPLCGTGMAFTSNIKVRQLEFGVSGLLYNSDVLMYDRQTGSLWSQIMKQAINGPLKGQHLEQLVLTHTSWRDWRNRHPKTVVLSDDTGYKRSYRTSPYPNYGRDSTLYFPVNHSNTEYRRKELVMGLEIDRQFKAYPFKELHRSPERFQDEFEGMSFDVIYDKKNKTARIVDENNQEVPTTLAFWFAWYAFHPDTDVYRE